MRGPCLECTGKGALPWKLSGLQLGNRDARRTTQKSHTSNLGKSRYQKYLPGDIPVDEALATTVEKPCGQLMASGAQRSSPALGQELPRRELRARRGGAGKS